MTSSLRRSGMSFYLALAAAALILGSCGGGGGDSTFSGGGSTNTGAVALSLTDWPSEDYDSIVIYVKRAFLLPADGGSPVLVFDSKSPDGYPVDLLDLRDSEDEFLLTIKKRVPAKQYTKIRLEIVDIEVFGIGECADSNKTIKLPSQKIDLNPRNGSFWLQKDETIVIKLDIDAEKSFNLHAAGKSGQCIFRPVVFVDVEPIEQPEQRCPLILAGEIEELLKQDAASPTDVTGFNMSLKEPWYSDPDDDRGGIEVRFDAQTKIFDKEGNPIFPNDLEDPAIAIVPGQKALVRGRLIQQGRIEASLVVLDAVEMKKGLVIAPSTEGGFKLDLANDAGELDVDLTGTPLLLTDCDTEYDGTIIPVGSKVRVFGKKGPTNESFRAVVVLIKEQNLIGSLNLIEGPENGGYNLFIEGYPDPIFLPEEAPVSLKGIYASDLDILQLQAWVDCKPRKVEVIPSNTVPNRADSLLVFQETLVTAVTGTDPANGTISYSESELNKTILVVEGAGIYRFMEGWGAENPDYLDSNTGLDDIKPEDNITAYGLAACPDDVEGIGPIDFYAHSVFVWPDEGD